MPKGGRKLATMRAVGGFVMIEMDGDVVQHGAIIAPEVAQDVSLWGTVLSIGEHVARGRVPGETRPGRLADRDCGRVEVGNRVMVPWTAGRELVLGERVVRFVDVFDLMAVEVEVDHAG